jgi:hypothetical protein
MHTKLAEFIEKMKKAAVKHKTSTALYIKGLENLQYAKMQSLRTGRIEEAVEEMAKRDDVTQVELIVVPRVPETMHTVIVKGTTADGSSPKAVVDVINILHPTEEIYLENCQEIEDRRPPIGKH